MTSPAVPSAHRLRADEQNPCHYSAPDHGHALRRTAPRRRRGAATRPVENLATSGEGRKPYATAKTALPAHRAGGGPVHRLKASEVTDARSTASAEARAAARAYVWELAKRRGGRAPDPFGAAVRRTSGPLSSRGWFVRALVRGRHSGLSAARVTACAGPCQCGSVPAGSSAAGRLPAQRGICERRDPDPPLVIIDTSAASSPDPLVSCQLEAVTFG
jgi:hypothetical protein